jgi:hypothetical protein
MADWSDTELRASVEAYRAMEQAEKAGEKYSKKEIYRQLAKTHARTEKAFEYRMQNISAVLDGLGQKWLAGLKPASNVGPTVREKLVAMLQKKPGRAAGSGQDYLERLPAIRARLIGVARAGAQVTYGQLMHEFDLNRFVLRHAMSKLGWQAQEQGEPILTALIVNMNTGRCSPGLEKEFGVQDDEAERSRLYAFWKGSAPDTRIATKQEEEPLTVRAEKFANVAVRPDQRSFREKIFLAYGGKCAVSGCRVRNALDAAHLEGRNWREGHNRAIDGILLRKDLHALYDAKLLRIAKGGLIEIDKAVASDYMEYAGTLLRKQKSS